MVRVDKSLTRHLTLDSLRVNLGLARRLSPDVACRYHALPVAEDDGRITVVMADPEDVTARETVVSALDAPACVVGGDLEAIDAMLAEIWPGMCRRPPLFLACAHASPVTDEVSAFAEALGKLLGAHVSHYRPLVGDDANCDGVARVTEQSGYELVVWGEPVQPLGRRLLSGLACHKARKRIAASLLVARRPRWPLKRLLLLIQDQEEHNSALEWIVRLARLSGATVTVLAVVPPVPAMYGRHLCTQQGVDSLLATHTTLGRQMRQVARWLVDWEVEATLRLRQGVLEHQVQHEVAQGDYDLIALSDQSSEWWRRCLARDWVASLLSWADRPVLITRPKTA